MLKPKFIYKTIISKNDTYEAQPLVKKLQAKVAGASSQGTEIDESIPIVYTDRAAGVIPSTDIRSDRFEIAREAMEKIRKAEVQKIAKTKETNEITKTETESPSNA